MTEQPANPPDAPATRSPDSVPIVVRVEQAHGAMLQNLGAIAAVVAFVLTGHCDGNVGLAFIAAVVGLIAYPSIKGGGGAALAGSIGVFGALAETLHRLPHLLPFVAVGAAMTLGGCLGTARDTANALSDDANRVVNAAEALCPADLSPTDPTYAKCAVLRDGLQALAADHKRLQDAIDSVTQ